MLVLYNYIEIKYIEMMKTFYQFIISEATPPSAPPASGAPPGGSAPKGGTPPAPPSGGPPMSLGGPPMGLGGGPPMGGGLGPGPSPSLGGPPAGDPSQGQTGAAPVKKLNAKDVWTALEKSLKSKSRQNERDSL